MRVNRPPRRPALLGSLVILLAAATVVGCAVSGPGDATPSPPVTGDDAVTVASFDFAESEVLAEVYAQALEGAGIPVSRQLRVGPREVVLPALVAGLVELVPEYAGTATQFLDLGEGDTTADVAAGHQALVDALVDTDLQALAPAPAQDANAFVVTRTTAQRLRLDSLDDLAAVAPELSFGGPPECPSRPLCLVGLEETYGVTFGRVFGLDVGERLTRLALDEGHIDVGLLFSTDPRLGDGGDLVVLQDDRGLQPAENVTPVVRRDLVTRFGTRLTDVVDGVSARLTTEDLRQLRRRVEIDGVAPAETAGAWLAEHGVGT